MTLNARKSCADSFLKIKTDDNRARFSRNQQNSEKLARGGTHDIFGRGCATIKSLYRPFLEVLTKKLDPFRNFCA